MYTTPTYHQSYQSRNYNVPIGTKLVVNPKVAKLRAGYYNIDTGAKCKDGRNTVYFNGDMKTLANEIVTVISSYSDTNAVYISTQTNESWILIPDWVQPLTLKEL